MIRSIKIEKYQYEVKCCEIGSEKQRSFGTNVKTNKICDMLNAYYFKPEILTLIDQVNEIVDSRFWIDNESTFPRIILKNIRDKNKKQ